MARMIPPFYEESITSSGEKKLFKKLGLLGDDFAVLHSLGIAEHRNKVFGEIDFVIICGRGIVCLEVKGGLVSRREGLWYFTDRYGKENVKAEGPFMQAVGCMYSLRDHLKVHFGPADAAVRCLYACGVVFPDMHFTSKGPDIIPEITYTMNNESESVKEYIHKIFAYWENRIRDKHGITASGLSRSQVERVVNYLRGDFSCVPAPAQLIEQTEQRLLILTRQQADRLVMADENPRILLKGTAGTGKTLLSMEYARRALLKKEKRVLFLCFNRNLCRYLKHNSHDPSFMHPERLHIDTMHGYLRERLKKNRSLPEPGGLAQEEYYRRILPEAFLEMIHQRGYTEENDVLVVDEGQDLLRLEYIMCMENMIRGGMEKGTWHICYDPNQNIYNTEIEEGLALIQEYSPIILSLDTNCRNTKQIGIYNVLATSMPPAKYLKISGEDVIRESYKNFKDEKNKVKKAVKRLVSTGISPGKICLLSRFRFARSCLQGDNVFRDIGDFQDISNLEPSTYVEKSIKFCTIHSFKGLEASVVIVLDVESFTDEQSRLLNYTAISRATCMLYIFYRYDLEEQWEQMVYRSGKYFTELSINSN